MTGEQMWAEFAAQKKLKDTNYDAWAFGDDPDRLARLVLEGVKTATSSAFPVYEWEGEPLPEVGEYSVVLDGQDEAVCVILTERVTVVPFQEIGEEYAFQEGEGDLSLAWWRRVHEAFFAQELARMGQAFTPDMLVVREEFRRVWPE